MIINKWAASLALGALTAQPALAAGSRAHLGYSNERAAAFSGVSLRVPLGSKAEKPQARLQLTTYRFDTARPATTRKFSRSGLELGVDKGTPTLFTGGRSTAEVKEKLGISTTTVVIIGGVVILVAVLALAANAASGLSDTCGEYEGNDDHCID